MNPRGPNKCRSGGHDRPLQCRLLRRCDRRLSISSTHLSVGSGINLVLNTGCPHEVLHYPCQRRGWKATLRPVVQILIQLTKECQGLMDGISRSLASSLWPNVPIARSNAVSVIYTNPVTCTVIRVSIAPTNRSIRREILDKICLTISGCIHPTIPGNNIQSPVGKPRCLSQTVVVTGWSKE